jgi:ubiquitin carboxyl-terminal hydrolase 48
MQKVDASRSLVLERIPPVLNIQLARYVFDMATFSKKKLATKVKLPRTLVVPTKLIQNDNAATTTTTTSKYILCAVQNHLGTSAHGGHYIADVMDWTTGVWYEFNDEDVSTLEQGPKSSFEPNESNSSAKCKGDKIDGSTDAYNLFYVEQSYLSQQSRIELKTTSKRIEDGLYGDDILTSIDVQRTERYNCEKE